MGKAARAIIVKDDTILVMHRNKRGKEYFTLVGGQTKEGEPIEEALVREIKEETGLNITRSRLVFVEKHPEPYNEQYIFLCEVGPHESVALQETSEEALMNRLDSNSHKPAWIEIKAFAALPFLTSKLQNAIGKGLKKGFPTEPTLL